MSVIVGWIVLSVIIGAVAGSRGRSGIGWFFLAILTSPLIALLLLLVVGRGTLPRWKAKRCPECAETVLKEARVCRYCGHSFTSDAEETGTTVGGFTVTPRGATVLKVAGLLSLLLIAIMVASLFFVNNLVGTADGEAGQRTGGITTVVRSSAGLDDAVGTAGTAAPALPRLRPPQP